MTIKLFFLVFGGFVIFSGVLGLYGIDLPDLRGGHSSNPKFDILFGIGIILVTLVISKFIEKKKDYNN